MSWSHARASASRARQPTRAPLRAARWDLQLSTPRASSSATQPTITARLIAYRSRGCSCMSRASNELECTTPRWSAGAHGGRSACRAPKVIAQRAQSLLGLPAEKAAHDRLEQPAQEARPGGELKPIGDPRPAGRQVGVPDRRRPGREERRRVDHLDGGDGRRIEGDVDRLQGQAAQRTAADADAGRALSGLREAVIEVGRLQERVPLQTATVVVAQVDARGARRRDALRDLAVRHLFILASPPLGVLRRFDYARSWLTRSGSPSSPAPSTRAGSTRTPRRSTAPAP